MSNHNPYDDETLTKDLPTDTPQKPRGGVHYRTYREGAATPLQGYPDGYDGAPSVTASTPARWWERCPRFGSCSAPICPFDPAWRRSAHLVGERTCLWLREIVKPGGMERVEQRIGAENALIVQDTARKILDFESPLPRGANILRRTLIAAAQTGSRLDAGERLSRQTRSATCSSSALTAG